MWHFPGQAPKQVCFFIQVQALAKLLYGTACHAALSCIRLFATLWTVARQAPLSMGFPRQEYWSGLPFPLSGDLLDPGIKPMSLTSAFAGGFFFASGTWEIPCNLYQHPFPEFFSSCITETLCPLNNNLQFPPPPSPWQPPSYLLSL